MPSAPPPESQSKAAPSGSTRAEKAQRAKKRGKKKGKGRKALGLTAADDPVRTCIVCRTPGSPQTMLRFARASDGGVGFDVNNRLPGAGAWVCATSACLLKATEPKHGGFSRAFEAACTFDGPALRADVHAALLAQVTERLGLLRRQGTVILGREEAVRRADELSAVGIASDLSDNSRHEISERVPDLKVVPLPTMAQIGTAVGGRPVGVVGIPRRGTDVLQAAIARWVAVTGTVINDVTPVGSTPDAS